MARQPNFLYVGPDKSGSSWLFKILESHPECYVPDCKDIYYFDKYFQRGEDWYLGFFKKATADVKAVGEISHGYLHDEKSPGRILRAFPDMKIITTLRNPVERSISHFFYLKSGGQVNSDLCSAVQQRPGIINSSMYYAPVKRYVDLFPRNQLNINFFETLKRDPKAYAHSVFQFLEISKKEDMDFAKRVREARKPKNLALVRILKLAAIKARDLGLTRLVGKIKNSGLAEKLYEPLDESEKAGISEEEKAWLLGHFREDIDKLQDLLEMDLAHWKQTQVGE